MAWITRLFSLGRFQFPCALAIAWILVVNIGCHPLGGRWRTSRMANDPSADDDWAPPKISRYAQPQQYSRKTPNGGGEVDAAKRSNQPIQPAEYQTPSSAQASSDASASPSAVDIQETGQEDLDIEGALAALPVHLRNVARKQFEALNEKSHGVSAKITDQSVAEGDSISEVQTVSYEEEGTQPEKASVIAAVATKSNSSNEVTPAASKSISVPTPTAPSKTHEEPESKPSESQSTSSNAGDETSSKKSKRPWKPVLAEAIESLEEELENPSHLDDSLLLSQELTLRYLYLANRQLNEAMRPIDGLDESEQDYFRYQLQALYEAGNPDGIPVKSRRWSLVMNSQRQATNHLAAASNLEVRSLAFCTDVQGYGSVTKFPAYQFKPDQEILLYCELENVRSEQVKAGFETQLQGTYQIIDPNGRRVADQLLPMEREICQNHRRDYFIIYHIFMPMQIAPGNYQMRVTIEDMKARKFGEGTLDFQIQK